MSLTYLSEVLTSEGSHLPNISSKILELINHMDTLKVDVSRVAGNCSIQFTPLLKESNSLKTKSVNLINEMTAVKEQIDGEIKDELLSCKEELNTLSSNLKTVNLFLEVLEELMQISALLREAKEKMQAKEFYECTQSIRTAQTLVENNSEKLKSIQVFQILSQEVVLIHEKLMHELSKNWSQCFSLNFKNNSENTSTEINIVIDIQSFSLLNQILKSYHFLKSNEIEHEFSQTLLNDIIKKVILKKSIITSKVNGNEAVLLIEMFNDNTKPNYLEVFDNLKTILEFLKSHLDTEIENGLNFLSKVGSCIADEFAECLITNCLFETIPTCSDDSSEYIAVVEYAEMFEKTLQEIGFLPRSSSSVVDYAKNINVLFANKFCQSYLHKARIIMKMDLINVTQSEDLHCLIKVLPATYKNILREKLFLEKDALVFKGCKISKTTEELMTLVSAIMKEIQKSSDLTAVSLFHTVRNIFEMYSAVVPLYHQKFLETLPYNVALFHNNCLYLAHKIVCLVIKYYNDIPSVNNDHFKLLLEEALVLRSLGVEKMEATITNINNKFIYLLKESSFAALKENPELDPNAEKCIRQCLRQLQIIQTAWSEVLPEFIYSRIMGFILDSIVKELIDLIISVEDISSQTAAELVSSFNVFLSKAPNLFPYPKDIHRHTGNWQKFKEFILVLSGSLRDIEERWRNGLGPLAAEFTAEQVKHLIRALFQNSERRAKLLSAIR